MLQNTSLITELEAAALYAARYLRDHDNEDILQASHFIHPKADHSLTKLSLETVLSFVMLVTLMLYVAF